MASPNPPFTHALLAGGIAGTTVDLSLFPLDTLKTRLQSSAGFFASGGFRGIYRGVGSAALGSAPGAAFFFCTYEATKTLLAARRSPLLDLDGSKVPIPNSNNNAGGGGGKLLEESTPADHMVAASLGEIAACAVRVPTEVVKQRAQAGQHGGSSLSSLTAILSQHRAIGLPGVWRELYRGWGITILREVPFTVIQFPLWEALKGWGRRRQYLDKRKGEDVGGLESAVYGSAAGAVAAGITTPLDVLKTRVMLSAKREKMWDLVTGILKEHGVRPFFAGIGPRVMWISIGGAIFLGSYQWAINALEKSRSNRAAAALP